IIHPVMIQNYFKVAWRIVSKNKIYSIINVFGLSLGVCACLSIYLIAEHEFNFDTFQADKDRIYRPVLEAKMGDNNWIEKSVIAPFPKAIRDEESVFEVVAAYHVLDAIISISDLANARRKFDRGSSKVIIAEPEYFQIFKYSWLKGDCKSLKEPNKVVLTESKSRIYFGTIDLDKMIGREIVYNDSLHVTVSGIIKDWDAPTDYPFTDFISFSTIEHSFLKRLIPLDDWNNISGSSKAFVKLNTKVLASDAAQALTNNLQKHTSQWPAQPLVRLQPLTDIHLNPEFEEHSDSKASLFILMGLAFFVLVIAAINFINLSTAQSIKRSKEIGIRKVMGSVRKGLTIQFLIETFVLTAFSVVIAALLVNPLFSFFNSFVPAGLKFTPYEPQNILFLGMITLVTTVLAGLYPARVLSSYQPSVSLKGDGHQPGGRSWLVRKGLIVFQFSFSIFFIVGALVMKNQLQMISESDKGFNTQGIVMFWTSFQDFSGKPKHLVEQIKQLPGVDQAALHGGSPMGWATIVQDILYKGKTEIKVSVTMKSGGSDYIPLYGIRLLAGRNINPSDSLTEFVINSKYAKMLGFARPQDAIGQILDYQNRTYPIVGVVEDFHEHSFRDPIEPGAIGNLPQFQHAVSIRLAKADMTSEAVKSLLNKVEGLYKSEYPDETFSYHFTDEEIGWLHDSDAKTARLVTAAMIITIFISALGVFGLMMFTAEIKTKEIAIRKVLGATVSNIAAMLSKEFVVLLAIAMMIAAPISWYYMSNWLMEFAFRINMSIWVYVLAFGATLLIGLSTVTFHTLRAAKANPARTLRAE
ncbi:MAG: FtsX-like permease family protein, partial [Chryseolinea sp.]